MKRNIGPFGVFLKQKRRETSLTQKDLANKAGVGLRFIRDVEQGKKSVRLDTLNAVLSLFGYCAGPVRMEGLGDGAQER
ncbi:MAG: type II toxin-antitoxin system Y4mF family antitoxin [Chitinivibrionales bacterium]|nr:type II toxin-antitoxin system Y4mF family antitoxin [Chitinivibrionales bacterium]